MKSNIIKIDVSIMETFDNNEDMLVIQGGKSILADIVSDDINIGSCINNCDCTNPKCK